MGDGGSTAMLSRGTRSPRVGLATAVFALLVLGLLLSVPVPTRATSVVPAAASQPTAYAVTWNSADVTTASSASSALSIDLTQSANLLYNWSTGSPVTINDARLQMYYLGFAVSTRDQIVSNPVAQSSGSIPLSWTPVSVSDLLEGVYRLTASFLAPNGTTMFSENFYVRGTAQLGILALLPIVLLILVVYEVYALVRSGRYASLGRKSVSPPPSTPPDSSTTTPPPSGPSSPSSGDSAPPPTGDSTPPSGGSS